MSQYMPTGQAPSDHGNTPGQYPGQPAPSLEPPKGKALAITALVLGILALLSFWTFVGGYLLGAAAIIVGVIALMKARSGRAGGRGLAIAGVILGALGLIAAIIMTVLGVMVFRDSGGTDFLDCVSKAGGDQAQIDQCEQEWDQRIDDKYGSTPSPAP